MEGFVKFHRQICDWEWYDDIKVFRLFFHLVLNANHKPSKWRGIEIDRGEILTGRHKLAEQTGLTEQNIRTCLNKLKSTNEITIKATKQFSIIKLNNYNKYQDNNQQLTNDQPTTNQQLTTNKNDNNKKNDNNIYIGELEELLKTWNELFETQHRVTPDMKRMYTTQRKTYSYEDIIQGCEAYYEKNKNNVKDVEWKNKYYLTLLKFITQKKNGFVSYL